MPQKRGRVTTNSAVREAASALFGGVQESWEGVVDEITERADIVIETAKDKLQAPISVVERVANKAIPAAIAACASLQYTGGVGSFANFLQPITLRTKYFYLDGSRAAFIGRPLNNTRVLNTLSGFVQCENVKLELSGATLYEQQLVKSYLEKGCYIET